MTLTSHGAAAPGWPTSGGTVSGDRLHMVSRNLRGTRLAEVDLADLTLVRERLVGGGDGAWGVATGRAGEVILGLFGAADTDNVLAAEGDRVDVLGRVNALYVWDLAVGGDGTVIAVTTVPSAVLAIAPGSGQVTDLWTLEPGHDPRTCTIVGGGLVVGGSRAGRAILLRAPLRGGLGSDILPSALRDDEVVYCSAATSDGRVAIGTSGFRRSAPAVAVVDPRNAGPASPVRVPGESTVDTIASSGADVVFTARPSGALYRLDRPSGVLTRLSVPVAQSETRLLHLRGGVATGVSADGTAWTVGTATGHTRWRTAATLGIPAGPQKAQSICAGDGQVDVGGSFNVTRHRVDSGGRLVRFVPGEAKAMVNVQGTTYMAIYPVGEVWSWRPRGQRPERLARLEPGQFRPHAMAVVPATDGLAVTTTDDHTRSFLHLLARSDGRLRAAVEHPISGQVASGVAVDGDTVYVGGSGQAPSIAAFDARSGARRWQVDGVIPDGSFLLGLGVLGGRLVVSSVRGWVTTIDLATRAVATPVRVAPNAGQMRIRAGQVLLATGSMLLRIDPLTRTATILERDLAGEYWGWAPMDVGRDGRTWLLRTRDLISRN